MLEIVIVITKVKKLESFWHFLLSSFPLMTLADAPGNRRPRVIWCPYAQTQAIVSAVLAKTIFIK